MRKLYTIFLAVVLTSSLSAQAPQKMSYQAVIRNSSDALVTNHLVGMKISILQGSSTGTPVFVETQIPTTNANGLVTIEIGSGTPVTGTLAGIDWSTGTYFIKTETDPTGGTSYSITGTSQILSVPYSLYAKTASTSADAVKITGDQSIAGNKTFTGTISASDKIITNVATPVGATDASNKAYVDELKQRLMELEEIVYTNTPLPSTGLVAYYPFNGNANDGSGNNLNGTISEAMPTKDRFGNENGAYYFNGISSFIKVSSNNILNVQSGNSLTISCWVKHDLSSTNVNTYIISKYSGQTSTGPSYAVGTGVDGDAYSWHQIAAGNNNAKEVRGVLNIHNGSWHNITSVINMGETVTLYVDGVLDKSVDFPLNGSIINDLDLYFGCGANQAQFYKGSIDDIRIYNRVLNQAEIKQLFNEGNYPNTLVEDIDGNSYNTVKIGNQIWMAENLKTIHYNDGTNIILAEDNIAWRDNTTGAFCWFNNNMATYKSVYGALYNGYAVSTGKLCPTGWHVPSVTEWNNLRDYMIANGYNYDGTLTGNKIGKALASENLWWPSTSEGAVGNIDYPKYRNMSGFNGVPGGGRTGSVGSFDVFGGMAYWWTNYSDATPNSIAERLDYNWPELIEGGHPKSNGYSVRCIKE